MKLSKTIIVVAAALACSVATFAQEDGNRDENGKIVHGPYETNKFWDNWFIGVGGGINWSMDNVTGSPLYSGIGGAFEINAGKWINPCWGIRAAYQGVRSRINDGAEDKNKAGFHYLHGDVLWNISNQFWGYKETRVYNAIPYLHAGAVLDYVGASKHGGEFAAGVGLLNNFRLADRVNLFLDLRGILCNGEQYRIGYNGTAGSIVALLGVSVNLGKTNWVRSANAGSDEGALAAAKKALEEAQAAQKDAEAAAKDAKDAADQAQKENETLADKAQKLADEVEALKNRPETVVENVVENLKNAPAILYFEMGQSSLSQLESQHMAFYADEVIKKAGDDVKFYLTGSADTSTGTPESNKILADARVNAVKNILINKYGVSEDRIVVNDSVMSDDTEHPELGRSVFIEHK